MEYINAQRVINAQGVCSENVVRSPCFQAVMRAYATKKGLAGKINFTSAGVNVHKFDAGNMPLDHMVKIVDAAIAYRVGSPATLERAMGCLERAKECLKSGKKEGEDIRKVYDEVKKQVHGAQAANRDEALRNLGIDEEFLPPAIYNPFDPEGGQDLVLAMNEAVLESIIKSYGVARIEVPEQTKTYSDFIDEALDITDDIAGGIPEAERVIGIFIKKREKVLQRIIEEFNIDLS